MISALFAGSTSNAHASLGCFPNGTATDFLGNGNAFLGFADDFENIAIGDRIGPVYEVRLKFTCTVTAETTAFGVGRRATPGITHHAATDTYTDAQLSAIGLGYRIWWHMILDPADANGWSALDYNPDLTTSAAPLWYTTKDRYGITADGTFGMEVPHRVVFYKINNNFQHTNGAWQAIIPGITANLFRVYVASLDAPTVTAGLDFTYQLTLNTVASKKRVCTPHVDQTIRFDYRTTQDIPATPGAIIDSTRDFSLTFDCPYMAWITQGFRMQPVYGMLDAANGVVGIKTGAGYAQGIGIQILVKDVATGWVNTNELSVVDNYTAPWQVVMPNQEYVIPALQYMFTQTHLDPATSSRSKQVNFRARYYRLPGALTAGKVESAVIFHFVYQ